MPFLCFLVFINTPYCLREIYQRSFKMFWNANPLNWYRLAFSKIQSFVFLQPISAVQPALLPWRRTRATRSVGVGGWPDCSMTARGMGAVGAGSHKRQSAQGNCCFLQSRGVVDREGREFLRSGNISEARHEKESRQAK